MWPDHYDLNVSRESLDKLEVYHALLLKWQKAINIVSNNTLDQAWVRHFADSAQMIRYIPDDTNVLMDWGSGGGFAGLVIAIMRPDLQVHLVESDERKCQFMRTVSRETGTQISIHTSRIESIIPEEIGADLITARALASLDKLLGYAVPFVDHNPQIRALFLKGAGLDGELEVATKGYKFESSVYTSITDSAASIISLSSIQKI